MRRKFAIQLIRARNRVLRITFRSLRHLFFFFLVGLPFRLVLAILRSSALLIDSYMPLDAPLREDFLPSPLLAANAAPAAICCFFDFAGIQFSPVFRLLFRDLSVPRKTTFRSTGSRFLFGDLLSICQVFVEDVQAVRPLFRRQMRDRYPLADRIFV